MSNIRVHLNFVQIVLELTFLRLKSFAHVLVRKTRLISVDVNLFDGDFLVIPDSLVNIRETPNTDLCYKRNFTFSDFGHVLEVAPNR